MLDWTLHLSDQIPLALDIETFAGITTLELGLLWMTDLRISTDSSETHISLPDREGHITVGIKARTASVMIQVPPDVAAYIHGERDAASDEIDLARFPMIERGHEYRSENYETASKRVDIRMDNSTSSVKIL